MIKEYLNKNEASEYMGMSLRNFSRLVKAWNIPSGKIPGGRIIFRTSDLKNLNERFFNAPEIKLQV